MASASQVQLSSEIKPVYYRDGISQDQSKKASELLQQNHDNFNIFFDPRGLHDHIAHHIVTLWALKASPQNLQDAFAANEGYQRPLGQEIEKSKDMTDPEAFKSSLGNRRYYRDYLMFFQAEIEKSSWQDVVQRYIFAGDEQANHMLARLFAGLVHSFIHLGFALETEQPALVAEALAQAACHDHKIANLFLPAEKAASGRKSQPSKTAVQLLDDLKRHQTIKSNVRLEEFGSEAGLIRRAGDSLVELLSQYYIRPEDLEEQVAASINTAVYQTAGAQRYGKNPVFDFITMHAVNSSLFLPAFMRQKWLSTENKIRLVEWKVRYDLLAYALVNTPELHWDIVRDYQPKHPEGGWNDMEDRACAIMDDGHTSKLIRALAHGQKVCQPYEHKDDFRVKGGDWLQIAHMAMDTSEVATQKGLQPWIRGAGFDEAWEAGAAGMSAFTSTSSL